MIKPIKNEKWKSIEFNNGVFRSNYAVSNQGRLASYTTNIQEGVILKGTLMGGYPTLKLKPGGENMTLFSHRLVAEAFLSPTALMAASSVFQRSSWKVFQETQMFLPAASAGDIEAAPSASAPAAMVRILRYIRVLLQASMHPVGRLPEAACRHRTGFLGHGRSVVLFRRPKK